MQNQIALYLIFITGFILLIGVIMDSDWLLGPSKIDDVEKEKARQRDIRKPFLTRWIFWLTGSRMYDSEGNLLQDLDQQRRAKRGLYLFLGILIIVLGIFALNSGKFN